MKLKDILSKAINKNNKQIVLTAKKKLIRKFGYDNIDDILNIKIENKFKSMLYKE